jgi:predicted ATPase/DNA-binding SARP family transcriptional activator
MAKADPNPSLWIGLLGPPEVTWAGRPVLFSRRQTRGLLYCLAAELRPVPRTQLCYLFWPDIADTTARRNLTRLLVLLRRALPQPRLLLADDRCVALDHELARSDTATFTKLTATADPAARRLALGQAVGLARGPFLEGFELPGCPEFEAWMDRERRSWERRTLDALAALIEAHTAEHDYAAAIAAARRYLQIDELAEEIHRRLIALYAATGDRRAALSQFEQCALSLERELGISPLPETHAIYRAARDGTAISPRSTQNDKPPIIGPARPVPPEPVRPGASLPAPASSLIGRAAQLAELAALLRRADVRLITLSGPGGSGKTRLAIEAARAAEGAFADGAAFVALAPLRSAALVIPAIMQVLGLPDQGDRPPLARLQHALRDREMLLVLDNFEHVETAAVEVAALLAAAPRLTILATSRALLHIAGEHSYPVPPLALADPAHPAPLDALSRVESIALFLARVQARLPSFQLTEANAGELTAICARLDGLPLAIELAAARAALLSPRMLLARLNRRLALLTDGPHDLPDRQRTLRATIDWSYRLLDVSEQLLFGRLAIFADGWGLEAAEAVAGTVGPLATGTLDGLQALLDKHLVQRVSGVDGEPRFTMLETLREYALERLAERGEAQVAQQAHAQHYLALAEAAAPALHGPEQIAWFDRLDEEHANLYVALAWLLEAGNVASALSLASALHWFWHVRGHFAEGRIWLERAISAAEAPDSGPIPEVLLARALSAVLELTIDQGDLAAAKAHAEQSVALWRALEADSAQKHEANVALLVALGHMFMIQDWQGDLSGSTMLMPELIARAQASADPRIDAWMALNHGRAILNNFDDITLAKPLLLQARELYQSLGDVWHQAQVLTDLGLNAMLLGDTAATRAWYEQALIEARRLKDRTVEAVALHNLGEVARLIGEDSAAAESYTASLRIYRDLDSRLEMARLAQNLGYLALHTGQTALARARFNESLVGFTSSGQLRGQAEALAALAALAADTQTAPAAQLAARLWGAAAAVHATLHSLVWPVDRAEITRYQAIARTTIGSQAFDAAYAEGASLSLEQAIAEALRV